jgi:hypothetical protein
VALPPLSTNPRRLPNAQREAPLQNEPTPLFAFGRFPEERSDEGSLFDFHSVAAHEEHHPVLTNSHEFSRIAQPKSNFTESFSRP